MPSLKRHAKAAAAKAKGKPAKKKGKGRPQKWAKVSAAVPAAKVIAAMTEFGATNREIAKVLGVHGEHFQEWQRTFPDLRLALKKGKERADDRVVDALYHQALKGNVIACIFWLKNRDQANWRDKRELALPDGKGEGTDDFRSATNEELRRIIDTRGACLLIPAGKPGKPEKAAKVEASGNNGEANGHHH